ncbi:MAG: hypothetical protein KKH93_01265 [Candidatus Omnitrophica bacterium]|nr:hypothetical protein [Candidatus Omnitrophota bacterium]MBU2045085.1 hypothetical protein [Candidatus Omnitrophota bacterium]MBU2473178.1 hypothetical protein [Candidatus Omnitrophota bacterium]
MKIKTIALFSCLFFSLIGPGLLLAQEINQVIAKSKEAQKSVNSVKIEGKTITGSIDVTDNQGLIDYSNQQFFAAEEKDSQLLRSVYVKDGIAYMYNGFVDSWLRFGSDINPVGDVFNKDKVFSQFPDNFSEAGFQVEFLEEETVDGKPCYVIESKVIDSEKAARFAYEFLDRFVSPQIAVMLKENKQMLGDYLKAYMQDSQSRIWIAKNSFLILKVISRHDQLAGPGESVSIEKETSFYDFNQPVNIEIPQEALEAPLVSAEELGLKAK